MKTLLFEHQGIAEADLDRVLQWHRKSLAGHDVEESAGRTVFSHQGGWWYRGETTVEPDPLGVRITYRVFNVATRLRWAVPLANRFFSGAREEYADGFAAGLRRLGDDLGVSAHPLT
jgi:hypothetical protein